jgi:uncharacterized protein YgiM (DUF1202 family)
MGTGPPEQRRHRLVFAKVSDENLHASPTRSNDIEMIVTTDTLNVRSGPGTGYSVTDQVHRGETVIYLNASVAWDWVNIKTKENRTGWCSSRYLMERTELFASPEDYPATGFQRALSDTLPMREGPGENHAAIVDLKFNRVVKVDVISPDRPLETLYERLGRIRLVSG